jgi:abortive infection bacteriophage resistance protein
MEYRKPLLSIEVLTNSLIERGLCKDEDKEQLKHFLSSIGYHRLSPYWNLFKDAQSQNKPRYFQSGTNLDTILKLYDFDRKLRLLVMESIEHIEVALRAYWSQELDNSTSHGYMDSNLFRNLDDHTESLKLLGKELLDNKEPFIVHYRKKYCQPKHRPPIWAVVEIMSFRTLSKWFENTQQDIQEKIADKFQIPNVYERIKKTEGVFHSLTDIRNVCAHHGRLWNRNIPNSAGVIMKIGMLQNNPKLLYNHLVLIHHLIFAISQENTWIKHLINLLNEVEPCYHKKMGFPDDWKEREPWKSNAP